MQLKTLASVIKNWLRTSFPDCYWSICRLTEHHKLWEIKQDFWVFRVWSFQTSRYMLNCKKYYFNGSRYILLKVTKVSFEKIKHEDFLMTATVGKIRKHISYVCGLTLNCEQSNPEYWNSWKGGSKQSLCRAIVANAQRIYCKNSDKIHKSKRKKQKPRKEW